jgi:hypothetical protein
MLSRGLSIIRGGGHRGLYVFELLPLHGCLHINFLRYLIDVVHYRSYFVDRLSSLMDYLSHMVRLRYQLDAIKGS